MERYQKSSHVVYKCKYHFVWVPKYRYRILDGRLCREELKEIIEQVCNWKGIVIIEGSMQADQCTSIFVCATEIFAIRCDEDTEREECAAIDEEA